jgi:adenylate kinase
MMFVAAVFGLSGVGKGWLISRFTATRAATHAQASQLMRDARAALIGRMESQEDLRKGAVLDNQALLIEAFTNLRSSASTPIIFDGHCVIDAGDRLIEIPVDVIEALRPDGLVFVRDDPAAIVSKRARDVSRTRPVRTELEVGQHQERALAMCARYQQRLGVGLYLVQAGDEVAFDAAISKIFKATPSVNS